MTSFPRPLHGRLREIPSLSPAASSDGQPKDAGLGREDHRHRRRSASWPWRARWRRPAPCISIGWSLQRAAPRRAAVLGAGHAGRHAGPDRPARRRLRLAATGRQPDGQRRAAPSPARPCRRAPTRCAISFRWRVSPTCCCNPGEHFAYNGAEHHLSRHPAGLLGGRQSVPSSPGPQPPAARLAQARDDDLARAVLDAGRARWPTSCCRPPPRLERDDIGCVARDRYMIAMKKAREPVGEARDDYDIFTDSPERMGVRRRHSRKAASEMEWLAISTRSRAQQAGQGRFEPPGFRRFWQAGIRRGPAPSAVGDARPTFAPIPRRIRSRRRRARSRFSPSASPRSVTTTARGHPTWLEPVEWLGGKTAERYPLHMLSDQPTTSCTASSITARQPRHQGQGPPADLDPSRGRRGARHFRWRPGARLQRPRRLPRGRHGDGRHQPRRTLRPAPGTIPTSRANRPLEKHGNPNALTLDKGTSKLAQGPSSQTALVEVERWTKPVPAIAALTGPRSCRPDSRSFNARTTKIFRRK